MRCSTFRGFTLVELLITLAVAALLLGVGLPAAQQVLASQNQAVAINTVVAALALARSTALTQAADVVVCPNAGGQLCGPWNTWGEGLLLFVDGNGNNSYEAANDRLIRESTGLGVAAHTTVGRPRVRFQPNGMALGFNATFTFCAPAAAPRSLILSNQGRTRVDSLDGSGGPLSCP
jgi:type IV fimbrial biogenesis protein FimT